MCEFVVYLKSGDEVKEVAKGVIKAVVENQAVKLITLLGEVTMVENAAIESVDVPNEKLILVRR